MGLMPLYEEEERLEGPSYEDTLRRLTSASKEKNSCQEPNMPTS